MKNKFCALLFLVGMFVADCALASTANEDNKQSELLKKPLTTLEEKLPQKENETKLQDFVIKFKPAGTFQTGGDNSEIVFDGRLQIDAGTPVKGKTSTNENNVDVRRFWLGMTGNVNRNWNYRLIVGSKNSQVSLFDAFVRYQGLEKTDILVGNFFENNGIDISSGNLVTPFLERSSGITTFRQFRRAGVTINPYGNNWGAHLGFFGNNPNSDSTTSVANANNKGSGFSGRVHTDFINDVKNSQSLHLGFNSSYRWNSNGMGYAGVTNKTMRFKSSGDSNILDMTLIDTGKIANVNSYYQNMAEFRYQNSSLTLTSEYIRTTLNRAGAQNINFNGGYFMASYFLGGVKYGYDARQGIQTLPMIGSNGALELAARYSTTDLNNKNIKGGKLNSYDFGVNYYPNNNIKLMVNYIFSHLDNSARIHKNPQYLLFRTQLSF